MSLFGRRQAEQRAVTEVPWDHGGDIRGSSMTQDRALRLAPVFAANRHLVDNISTLPLKPFRKIGDERQPMRTLPPLFQFMDEDGTLSDWLTKAVLSMGIQGNAIGIVTNLDQFGFPTAVNWRPRGEFTVDDTSPARPQWYWNGRRIDTDQVVHIPWLTVPGRTLGLSPLEAFALSVDAGITAQEFGNGWFAAGGVPPGTFKNTSKTVNQEEAAKIKARLVRAIKSREPIVYGSDWEFSPITIPPNQAQFVETQKLTANQIASIYGIAPDEVGGEAANSLTYANEEMRQTTRMANLRPWLVRLEAGFAKLLPKPQYVRFAADAVVRADIKARHETYRIARDIGIMSINEIRALEDRQPLPPGQGGDDHTPLAKKDPEVQAREADLTLNGSKRWQIPA